MQLQRTYVAKAADGDPLEYVMSDDTVDRMGDIIEPSGWQTRNFNRNPIALFAHDSKFIVGHWKDVRVEGGALRGRLELLDAVSDRLREVHAAVKAGILRAVSVGFRPVESEPRGKSGGMRFIKSELVECSLVSIPANPNALAVAKSLHLSADTKALIFGKSADEDGVVRRSNGESAAFKPPISGRRTMNAFTPLSKRIEDAEAHLLTLKDQLTENINKADAEQDEESVAVSEELNGKIDLAQRSLDALKRAEASLASKSDEPVTRNAGLEVSGRRPFAAVAKKIKPADYVYRAAVVALLSRLEQKPRDLVRQERYGDDEQTKLLTDVVTKASTVPATTTLTGWAAELVGTSIAEFLDDLMPQSAYPRLSAIGGRFTFGRAGIVSIPSRVATPTLAGSFVPQGGAIPVRQGAFQAVTITPRKMAVISTFTREIAEHSTPAIEGLIRQAMQEDTAVSLDTVLFDATAASTTRPAGLRNGVTVTTATSGGGFAALVGDIKNLVGVLSAANSLRNPVWIMNPAQVLSISMTQNAGGDFPFAPEINGGNLRGYPIIQSTTMTAGMVLLVDAADFFSATGDEPRFDVSDTATLHLDDTTPLAIGTAGSPNTVAAPVRSLFQTDTIAIRMMLDVNWAMRRTGVIAWTTSVTW
jgi:HK97 family phage major capsid protein/HK97 family phage prohead protease